MTTAADLQHQLARQRGVRVEGVSVEEWGPVLAQTLGVPWVMLGDRYISPDLLRLVPRDFVLEHAIMPYDLVKGVLQVAMVDPLAVETIDSLAHLTGVPIQSALAGEGDIRQFVARCFSHDMRTEAAEAASSHPPFQVNLECISESQDAPVINLVQELIGDAIRRRASDIHLEPLARRFRVRHRIDGVLHEATSPDQHLQLPVISRLKIMAGMSIAEKRLPQDGRIQADWGGRNLDLRASSLPTVHGESMVLRILDKENLRVGLPELGFMPDEVAVFSRQITAADGMMLVTGPTGSGKTTTLYASLHHLNQSDRKIITVEDPVEYQITGINQVPVNPAIGLTFAATLRAMLRQAPNIIMVGEIRDRETADIAINASLTGHLVFSTLHTNDAPSAVTRLLDIGTKPFLVAAALRSVVAQRLVRRICPRCRQSHRPSSAEIRAVGLDAANLSGAEFARGAGCPACQGTGYRGRLGIFEIFLVHEGIRAMIYDNVTAARLRQQARLDGMRTMREDGIRKILAGLTTIEEVVAATAADQA